MNRLLSPNETKFWLLDWVAPMNSVAVVQRTGARPRRERPVRFSVPVVHLDGQTRPRWGEPDRPGSFVCEDVAKEEDWLPAAQRLLQVRVGNAGQPPWYAVEQSYPGGTTLLLAVNHALTDWRTSLHVANAFLEDEHPGALSPPCEEMLPSVLFRAADAEALLDSWWSSRAGARWHAIGLDGLTGILPSQGTTRFVLRRLSQEDTTKLQNRCAAEGATLNSALAVALRDTVPVTRVAHSVDMARFIQPPPATGPGLAVSHAFTPVPPGPFWDSARDNRAELFGQIRDGAVADILLELPRLLLGAAPTFEPAAITITGAPTVGRRAPREMDDRMELVVSSARGGGGIVIVSTNRGQLQLIAGTPAGEPDVPLEAVIGKMLAACV